jgi:single-strand DNA-binding protein
MSLNLNHVTLAGNLTRDPELRQIGADRVVASTGIAINRRWKDQATGEQREDATFVEVEAWGRTAELLGQYLKKGSPAYIEGRLKLDAWDDKESGQKRSKLKVVADSVQFLGTRPPDDASAEPGHPAPAASTASAPAPRRRPAAAAPQEGGPPF